MFDHPSIESWVLIAPMEDSPQEDNKIVLFLFFIFCSSAKTGVYRNCLVFRVKKKGMDTAFWFRFFFDYCSNKTT